MQISRTAAVGSASNAGAPSSRRSGSNALSRHPSLATLMLAHRRRPLGAYADRRSYGRSKRYMRSKTPFTRISSAVSYPIGSATGIGLDCALSLARRAYPAPLRRLLSPLERSEASERYGDEGIAPMGTRHAIAFVGTARPRGVSAVLSGASCRQLRSVQTVIALVVEGRIGAGPVRQPGRGLSDRTVSQA
jgi:hypothetical protein